MHDRTTIRIRTTRGQALVEVMVAVGILSVGFLGVIGLLSNAFGLNRVAADNYVGTYLAAEGIEVAKNIIDSNILHGQAWNNGLSNGDYEVDATSDTLTPCIGICAPRTLWYDGITHLYTYNATGTQTTFKRRITITLVNQNEVSVSSQVTWIARGGGTSNVTLEDHFYNWR